MEMYIGRGSDSVPDHAIEFCLDQLERYGFEEDIDWRTKITSRLYVEEMIGALIFAENMQNDFESYKSMVEEIREGILEEKLTLEDIEIILRDY